LQDLRKRTREYSLQIIHLYRNLPKSFDAQILGKQLFRSGTSAGAHYHEACRAKSPADFVNKIEGALQELDETTYWLNLLSDSGVVKMDQIDPLLKESEELIAMFVSITKNVKQNA
jgi:four helix bundle protein